MIVIGSRTAMDGVGLNHACLKYALAVPGPRGLWGLQPPPPPPPNFYNINLLDFYLYSIHVYNLSKREVFSK